MPDVVRYTPAQMVTKVNQLVQNYNDALNVFDRIEDSIEYSKEGTQYESDLVAARAEIAEDNGYFEDISEAIQSKTGQAEPYDKSEIADAISEEWVQPTLIQKTITANGTYAAEDDNADGYSEVTVAVPREITKLVDGTITEYVDDEVTEIRDAAFYDCQNLITCDCENVISIGAKSFYNCKKLNNFNFSNVETIGQESFKNARLLPDNAIFRFSKCKIIDGYEAFYLAGVYSQYRRAIFPALETLIATAFRGGTYGATIATLVFKKEVTLSNYNSEMFSLRNGNNDAAKIYVPQALLNHFQTATNWSAGYASYPNAIKTIEDNLDYLISLGFTREELLRVDYEEATS